MSGSVDPFSLYGCDRSPYFLLVPKKDTGIDDCAFSAELFLKKNNDNNKLQHLDLFSCFSSPFATYQVRNTTTNWVEAGQSVRAQVPYPAQPKYDMKNLKPDSFYRVELRAHNVIGFSAPAEIYLRTAKGQSLITHTLNFPSSSQILRFLFVTILKSSVKSFKMSDGRLAQELDRMVGILF